MNIPQKAAELLSLDGKVAMVTGGASGIGRGIVSLLAEMGAAVAILDVAESAGRAVEAELVSRGMKALFVRCDVCSANDCAEAVRKTLEHFGRVDILCNNAGVIVRKNVIDLPEKDWDRVLHVTLKAVYLLSREVIPHMIRGGGGSIVNTGSGWSLKAGPNAAAYCAAKAGVLNLTRAMAIDHGKGNIRVNCVCPGDVDTPMLQGECQQLGDDPQTFMQQAAARPLGRVGTPEDVAKAVLFLASQMSSWITGTCLVVDGGGLA